MKQLTFLSKFLFIALFVSMFASCDETGGTGGGTTFELPPVVDLQSGADFVTSSASISAEDIFKVSIKADEGDNPMSTFVVLEDGVEVDPSRINFSGVGFGSFSNPYTLTSAEQASFAVEMEVISQSDASTRTYTFRVTDSKGNTDDTTVDITTSVGPLTVTFTEMSPFTWLDFTIDQQATVKFQINGTRGGALMSNLTVLEDDVAISDLMRLRVNTVDDISGATNFAENPLPLSGDDQQAFSWVIYLSTHGDNATKKYTFRVTDADGTTEEVSINITVNIGTPIVSDLTGKLLLNADDINPNSGSINLLTGEPLGTNHVDAHLKDLGIDTDQPVATNWIRKVAPTNGSTLKKASTDFPTGGIGFIQFQEEIQSAFDAGTTVTESDFVLIGDIFLVQAATGEIFIVEVTNINETSGDNDDYYELAIKR